ncbi:hypothetical protein DXG01_004445 [Tephrocybe rancida]|nr:hypothetical protein DXG01_004445 [Tephrocybe rancida]
MLPTVSCQHPASCPVPGCGKQAAQLHADCARSRCRKHCIDAGGCSGIKTHYAPLAHGPTPPPPSTELPAQLDKGKACAMGTPPQSPQPRITLPTLPTAASSPSTAHEASSGDLFANPRYASQLAPAFTLQNAIEQSLEEKRREADEVWLASIERAKNHVIVYAWSKDNEDLTIFEVQGGFTHPRFVITAGVLVDGNLVDFADGSTRIMVWNPTIGSWTRIPVNHVVTLKAGERLFLKNVGVMLCNKFDELVLPPAASFNIRTNIRQERDHLSSDKDEANTSNPAAPSAKVAKEEDLDLSSDLDEQTPPPAQRPKVKRPLSLSPILPMLPSKPCEPGEPGDGLSDPIDVDDDVRWWPADFYVEDVVKGFKACEWAHQNKKNIAQAFEELFDLNFISTTFY